jgi:hypothetical protein
MCQVQGSGPPEQHQLEVNTVEEKSELQISLYSINHMSLDTPDECWIFEESYIYINSEQQNHVTKLRRKKNESHRRGLHIWPKCWKQLSEWQIDK